MRGTGQYNLNFIDWENEWEQAEEAMNEDPDDMMIEGILNGDIERMYQDLLDADGDEEEKTGISEEQIKKFPMKFIKTEKQLKEFEDPCVICLSEYKLKSKVLTLRCKHNFHFKCIKKWFEGNTNCPKCR